MVEHLAHAGAQRGADKKPSERGVIPTLNGTRLQAGKAVLLTHDSDQRSWSRPPRRPR